VKYLTFKVITISGNQFMWSTEHDVGKSDSLRGSPPDL